MELIAVDPSPVDRAPVGPSLRGGAASATGHAVTDHAVGVVVMNIGDSRCYRPVAGALTLVTRDHSHVQELVDHGRITPAEVHGHRPRHVVTRALGVDAVARPEVVAVTAPVGRRVPCSDGITAELPARTIGRVLTDVPDPQVAAERLVELAVLAAVRDDVTAVVVDQHGGMP